MKTIKIKFLGVVIALLCSFSAHNQCNTNTSICTPGTAGPFNFVSPGPYVSSCLDFWGPNMGYIILHITSSGPLNMLIDGNSSSGFLDVAVFNIPAGQSPCTAIQNTANEIGCNYASAASGCNQFGNAFPCTSSVPAPNVTAGQEIMIVVENWSGSSSSFTMSLGPAPGAQTGPPNPAITPVGPFCVTGGTTQLIAADMGGTWTGPGVSSTGVFNPATAGIGTHTINYSVGVAPCNAASSTTITVTNATVTPPPAQTICAGGSATLTASGATNYTWSPSATLNTNNGATVIATPSVTTTYTVTGTTGSCSSSATVTVTVGSSPTVVAEPNITVCAGAIVPLNTFTSSPAGASFNWTNNNTATGCAGSGSTNIPAFTATNNTSAAISSTISVTPNIGTCVGPASNFTITVNPSPTINPLANQTYCAGDPAPVTTVTAVPPTATVTWTNSNTNVGLGASGNGNVSAFTATNSAGGSITGTVTLTPTFASCTGPAQTYTITVGSTPNVNAVSNISVCNGSTVNVPAFTGSVPGTSYAWTNSNPAIGLSASGNGDITAFTGSNAGTTPVTGTITVTPSIGTCVGTPITFDITINPSPSVTVGSNSPICEGQTLNLTANGPAGATYSWTGPNSFSSNLQNPSINSVTAAANGTYNVTVTTFSCTVSASLTVVINPGSAPTITPVSALCQNAGAINLVASVAGGVWSGPGITNGATGQFSPSSATVGSNVITYTLSSGCSVPSTTTITVNPVPVVQFSTSTTVGCEPLTAVLTDNSVPPSSSVTWDFGDGTTSNQTGNINHTFMNAGCYTVSLTSTSNGCTSSASQPNFICVIPYADASFSVDDQTLTIMNSSVATFNSSTNASIYHWDFGDGATSSAENGSHNYPSEPGSYSIMLVANNAGNCPDTAWVTIVIETETIFYVPNAFTPDGDEHNNVFLPIFTSGFDPQNYNFTVYNRWGEVLFESNNHEFGWDGIYHDQLCKEGTYMWTIWYKTDNSDKKVTKQGHFSLIK